MDGRTDGWIERGSMYNNWLIADNNDEQQHMMMVKIVIKHIDNRI